jgi:hypothetical protein
MGEDIKCNLILRGKNIQYFVGILIKFCNDLRFDWRANESEWKHSFEHFLSEEGNVRHEKLSLPE